MWHEVLGFLALDQLGKRASLACRRLNALAQAWIVHERRARVLPDLEFRDSRLFKWGKRANRELPIAQVAPPKNILGFNYILIS